MKSESRAAKKKRAEKIYKVLRENYPGGKSALKWQTPVQMLVATVLSAQTTDKNVNRVTQDNGLFRKYKIADNFARANLKTFEQEIKSLGFYHNKAKNIIAACKMLRDEYGGKIPVDINELIKLPGVARKTANIVLNHVYNIAEGIAVDTHVIQVATRCGLTQKKDRNRAQLDPNKIERDLMALYPKKYWRFVNYAMVDYNRDIHSAEFKRSGRKDPLVGFCPSLK